MRATLHTPYSDTRADALCFTLGLPPLDALATLSLVHAGVPVELRLLGASHQVIAGPVSETVACLPGRSGSLPGGLVQTVGDWSYEFTAEVRTHDPGRFEAAVDGIAELVRDRPDALIGTFPGSSYAVTSLLFEPAAPGSATASPDGAMGWRTWHAYPQTREIVITRSRMVRGSSMGWPV
jgi:hypothetical protein